MNSIRKRLLFSILAILTLATLAVGIATYLGMRHEMDELYDANMRQLAIITSNMAINGNNPDSSATSSTEWPRGEENFLIQIFKGGKLIYTSHPVADFPLQEKSGHENVSFRGKTWTYYQVQIADRTIQVSQNTKERREVIREVYKAIIIPVLIQFPIVAVLVWLLVSYGFRPLVRISDLIQKRTASYMQPIPLSDAPDEILSLVTALNDLLLRLEESLETQRRFTADAAHELRTPLTAVRLQLDLLQRAKGDEDRQEALKTLERGVTRSTHLVQQLLELARQEPHDVAKMESSVNLAALIQTVTEEQRPLATAKSITVKAETQALKVKGDAAALSVLIGNLLSNAIAYTPDHGNILVRVYPDAGRPAVSVADDGIGIKEEDRNRIFDRFYRVIGGTVSGSGLGLSIVKAIADKHGADIAVSDGIGGKGTTFSIIFPALSLA